tara:strand:- start:101 stop:655 length:555 start_codon:yes stop_codon:yes gene_type:complete
MAQRKLLTIDLDWIQNPRQFNDILSLCMELFKNKIPTIFIKSHHEIYNHINEEEFIINIDHHHDFGYDNLSIRQALDNMLREGNWVLGAAIHKKLKGYVWIKNYNSVFIPDHITDWIRNLDTLQIRNKIEEVDFKNIYKVVICESAEYEKNVSLYSDILKKISRSINPNTEITDNKNSFKHLNS